MISLGPIGVRRGPESLVNYNISNEAGRVKVLALVLSSSRTHLSRQRAVGEASRHQSLKVSPGNHKVEFGQLLLRACNSPVGRRLFGSRFALPLLPGEVFLTVRRFGLDTLPCAKSRSRPGTQELYRRKGKNSLLWRNDANLQQDKPCPNTRGVCGSIVNALITSNEAQVGLHQSLRRGLGGGS